MMKDTERIDRLFHLLDEYNVDALLVTDEVNIRYIIGATIDYSLVYVLKEGKIGAISPLLEFERANRDTWADEVYAYSSNESGEYIIKAANFFEAFRKLNGSLKNIAIPFSKISHFNFMRMNSFLKDIEIIDADDLLLKSRIIKSSMEIRHLRKGAEIVDKGVWKGIESIKENMSEKRVAYISECYMKEVGADKVYDYLIVASGERSALPHGRASDKIIMRNEGVTLDFVASYNGYYGDETRTVFLGNPNSELKKIYEIVLTAQGEAIEHVEEGLSAKDIDHIARDVIEKAGYGKYYIHSTGHGLGLEVHEKPTISMKDETILKKGMVITVEPGIYIPGLGGVRIEDDILITSGGHEVLTKNPKELIVI